MPPQIFEMLICTLWFDNVDLKMNTVVTQIKFMEKPEVIFTTSVINHKIKKSNQPASPIHHSYPGIFHLVSTVHFHGRCYSSC